MSAKIIAPATQGPDRDENPTELAARTCQIWDVSGRNFQAERQTGLLAICGAL